MTPVSLHSIIHNIASRKMADSLKQQINSEDNFHANNYEQQAGQ